MPIATTVVESPAAFEGMRAEWDALLARSQSESITLTWAWLATWWKVYGEGRALRIVAVREGDRLIGAAPLLARTTPQSQYKVLPFHRIELLASGEAPGEQVCSDYIGWIAETGRESEVVEAIVSCLYGDLGDEWDELRLPDVSAESPLLEPLRRSITERGLRFEVLKREPCAIITLPRTWKEFLDSASQSLRYKIRRGRKEVDQAGGAYRVVRTPEELGGAIDTLIRLHQQRWNEKGKPGAFASERRRRFHELLMPLALAEGWLRLGVLEAGGEPIGAIYNFEYGRRIFFYQSGIALPANQHLRPGLLMHSYEVEHAIDAGCLEYDFLKRGHGEYKDTWANRTRDLLAIRIARPGVKESALDGFRRVHDTLRTIKQRMRSPGAPASA
jgi:CelD/BcsL family acetyltransferase involved in cellulose biosynthesis